MVIRTITITTTGINNKISVLSLMSVCEGSSDCIGASFFIVDPFDFGVSLKFCLNQHFQDFRMTLMLIELQNLGNL